MVTNWESQGIGTDIKFVTEDEHDYRRFGTKFIETKLKERIDTCEALLVLVGNNCHNRPWLDFEIKHTTSTRKRVLWVRLKDTNGEAPIEIRNQMPIETTLTAIQLALRNK